MNASAIGDSRTPARRARVRGFSLIELMIAMVLGLIVSGAAVALFFSNSRTYASTESLGRIQESARTAFELMARDVRESAGNACGTALADTVNVLNNPTANWYADFNGGVRGYGPDQPMPDQAFGMGRGTRVRGTDAIDLKSVFSGGVTIQEHDTPSAQLKVNTKDHGLHDGDIAMACDANHAAIFQVTNAQPGTNATIVHNTGTGSPGNCSKGMGSPLLCTANGTSYEFGCAFGGTSPSSFPAGTDCGDDVNKWTAILAKLRASRWWVGNDGDGGQALFQTVYRTGGAEHIEVADGVNDMTLSYLLRGANQYVPAAAVGANWPEVVSVRIDLDMVGQDRVGSDGRALARNFDHTVTIRNRMQ